MVGKKKLGEKVFDSFNYIAMCLLMIATLYPLIHIFFASLSEAKLLDAHRGFIFYPLGFNLTSYKAVFSNKMVGIGYLNTVKVIVFGVIISLTITSIGAYFLSRRNIYWKGPIVKFIVFTMYFSGGMIPSYLIVKNLGLMDNIFAMIVPYMINTHNLIVMKTSLDAIPAELEESASIDGANHLTILFRIIVPVAKPIIAVMALYYGVSYWNSWAPAMMYIKDRSLYPLQMVLREIIIESNSVMTSVNGQITEEALNIEATIKYATMVVGIVPILCVYPFLQKYFVKGVMIGSLKG